MNSRLNFNDHSDSLYSKANQKFGMLKRTCNFVKDTNKRRALYLTLVRSLFEHCPMVWRPASKTIIEKLESLQKRALKWIRNDRDVSYSTNELYYIHYKQLNILPIKFRFDYHDLKFFHSIVYNISCVKLPYYLTFFSGSTRLRSTHLDHLCFVSSVRPSGTTANDSKRGFANTFFYRTHLLWNRLPLLLREVEYPGRFRRELINYIWTEFVSSPEGNDPSGSEMSDEEDVDI